jgi:hypothetical protein
MIYVIKELRKMTKKNRPEKKRFTTYLNTTSVEEIHELADRTGLSISYLIQEAIDDVLVKWNGKGRFYEK